MRIGVFDSGIGGLTVLKELIKYHKNNEYIYYGDTKNIPYGNKSKEELMGIASNIIDFFISERVDLIIIACGTISSTIFNDLKSKYKIPLYNVIDSTINYINSNNIDNICILATEKTIASHTFKNKLKANNVEEIACPNFVPIIEDRMNEEELPISIEEYLHKIKNTNINNIVLGCTHYPLISNEIKDYLGNVNLYNMGEYLAKEINIIDSSSKLKIYFSYTYPGLKEKIEEILDIKIDKIECI